jgi:RHS repeat-associated protein
VTSVSGSLNATYTYDPNGNMTGGNGRTFTYTSFNMPVTITGNGYTYTYTYGPDHERVRLVHSTLGTFIYLNAGSDLLYEKETRPGGLVEHKHYLSVGGSSVGVYLTRSDATNETRYFHHDHIGSLTLVTNASGAVIERLAYEAFGKRRFPNGTDDPNNTLFGVTTDRGFTMHEHLDEITLVHMNGRIYDPLLARFITPDPFIQAPYNLQAYNRYSYGFNNPLRGYDPSGYGFFSDFFEAVFDFVEDVVETVVEVVKAIVKPAVKAVASVAKPIVKVAKKVAHAVEENLPTVVAIGATIVAGHIIAPALGLSGAAAGAFGGFVGGFVGSGGDIEQAIIGGITGAAFGAIGGSPMGDPARVLAHATVGCLSSAASGGSCGAGALSAGVAKFASLNITGDPVAKGIAIAAIGGTASVLGGGSFANGAVTASFGYLFNEGSRGLTGLRQMFGGNIGAETVAAMDKGYQHYEAHLAEQEFQRSGAVQPVFPELLIPAGRPASIMIEASKPAVRWCVLCIGTTGIQPNMERVVVSHPPSPFFRNAQEVDKIREASEASQRARSVIFR